MGPEVTVLKKGAGNAAVVFIHGFRGKAVETWGAFPSLLGIHRELNDWSILAFGYETSLKPDLAGILRGNPPIQTVADKLRRCLGDDYPQFGALVLVAHSMGGLVTQRALADDSLSGGGQLIHRVRSVVNFGTPSDGLWKASPFRLPVLRSLYRQVADMAKGGIFIKRLRADWDHAFGKRLPFLMVACAGASDEFVPRSSSHRPFVADIQKVVDGDHSSITMPSSADDPSVRLVVRAVRGREHDGQDYTPTPTDTAQYALEEGRFEVAATRLEAIRDDLSKEDIVNLALAYDATGRRMEAIAIIESNLDRAGTDALGTLAGRYKREWWQTRKHEFGLRAAQLYRSAYSTAEKAADWPQAYYLGINVAFLQLLLENDPPKARKTAEKVLSHCDNATDEQIRTDKKWWLATQGEALLMLRRTGEALRKYTDAIACKPELNLRERGSMYRQAVRIADALRDAVAFEELQKLLGLD